MNTLTPYKKTRTELRMSGPPGGATYEMHPETIRSIVVVPVEEQENEWEEVNYLTDELKKQLTPITNQSLEDRDLCFCFIKRQKDSICIKGALKCKKTGNFALITACNAAHAAEEDAIAIANNNKASKKVKSLYEGWKVFQSKMIAIPEFWKRLKETV